MLKVISGGQSGTDRGALTAAMKLGYPCGGWCPKGRLAEDGGVPEHFPVAECDSADYRVRTRLNVVDADATLILTYEDEPTGGTALTLRYMKECGKRGGVITLDRWYQNRDALNRRVARLLRDWLAVTQPSVLNVAGPRESKAPGIQQHVTDVMLKTLQPRSSCICGREIPEDIWSRPAVRAGAALRCSSCAHETYDLDFQPLEKELLAAIAHRGLAVSLPSP